MEFKQAIRQGFEGYIDIHTRASRQEFWLWWVFVVLVSVVAGIVNVAWLQSAVSLVLFLPTWTLFIRRLHDIGHSGWWVLVMFVPLINLVAWLYVGLKSSDPLENSWG